MLRLERLLPVELDPIKLLAAATLVVFAAGLLQVTSPFDGNSDVSWLIVVAEKVLDGKRLYADILETNPPMSLLLYLPPVWLARQTGIASELMVHTWVALWAAVSLTAVWRWSEAAGIRTVPGRQIFVALAAYMLLILPAWSFGQREHLAAIGLLPYLMLTAGRWNGARPGLGSTLPVGVLAGLALCIKPHFALVLLLPSLARVAASRRPLALLNVENVVAAGVAAAYLVLVLSIYPQFLGEMMPLNRLVYLPSTLTPRDLLVAWPSQLAVATIVVAVVLKDRLRAALPIVLLAAAAGGLGAYIIQAKGWPYHLIPSLIFALLALAAGIIVSYLEEPRTPAYPRIVAKELAAGMAAVVLMGVLAPRILSEHTHSKSLEAEIRKLSPAPSIMIASSNLGVHFPLVRRTNAKWESRAASLWIMEGVARTLPSVTDPQKRERLIDLYRWERAMFVEDALRSRPEMIGLAWLDPNRNLRSWADEVPEFGRLLHEYRQVAIADEIALFVRTDLEPRNVGQAAAAAIVNSR